MRILILSLLMMILVTYCTTEPEEHKVEYYFKNVSIGYSYYDPITREIVTRTYPYNKTFTKTFENVPGGLELEAYGVCNPSAYGVTVGIIVDNKYVAEDKDYQNAGVKYFLK